MIGEEQIRILFDCLPPEKQNDPDFRRACSTLLSVYQQERRELLADWLKEMKRLAFDVEHDRMSDKLKAMALLGKHAAAFQQTPTEGRFAREDQREKQEDVLSGVITEEMCDQFENRVLGLRSNVVPLAPKKELDS